jgi:NADPH2:quinone reductase
MRREPARYVSEVNQLGQWYREGRLKPHIDRTFPLECAADALTLMATRRVTGKVVLTC